jgi:chromosome segregation ATPase
VVISPGGPAIDKDTDSEWIETEGSRILTLEHALDQALLVIEDLRSKLQVQNLLEHQLAETESCSHIQQKAILSFKQQLRLEQDRLQQCKTLQDSYAQTIVQVQKELVLTALKKEELERQVDHLSRREAQLQQQGLEMKEQCERQERRIQTLETQMAELQEQVLHQAQQLHEQEMATQHWKERCQSFYPQCQALLNQLERSDRGQGLEGLETLRNFLDTGLEDDRLS